MHGYIADRWRSVVTQEDKVYVLGDVSAIKSTKLLLAGLPGKKRLVRGNHDMFSGNSTASGSLTFRCTPAPWRAG